MFSFSGNWKVEKKLSELGLFPGGKALSFSGNWKVQKKLSELGLFPGGKAATLSGTEVKERVKLKLYSSSKLNLSLGEAEVPCSTIIQTVGSRSPSERNIVFF